jgi:hypothetical protein
MNNLDFAMNNSLIVLEKILPVDDSINYPICTSGEMLCPPEDCLGIEGYSNILKILEQPDHIDHNEAIEWLGEDYNPAEFDIDEINFMLLEENFGCPDINDEIVD